MGKGSPFSHSYPNSCCSWQLWCATVPTQTASKRQCQEDWGELEGEDDEELGESLSERLRGLMELFLEKVQSMAKDTFDLSLFVAEKNVQVFQGSRVDWDRFLHVPGFSCFFWDRSCKWNNSNCSDGRSFQNQQGVVRRNARALPSLSGWSKLLLLADLSWWEKYENSITADYLNFFLLTLAPWSI